MIRNVLIIGMLALLGVAFWTLTIGFVPDDALNRSAAYYAANAQTEVGTPNIVTGIIITWRGLDTLGEVTVLFLTSAIVAMVLPRQTERSRVEEGALPGGELLATGARMLLPLIVLLGFYVILNGHLTPGGGFQGGAILASGLLLVLLADPTHRIGHAMLSRTESMAGATYVVLGLLGLAFAGGFLDNAILPLGQFGAMVSAGTIPLISILIGLKVGAEFASIMENLHDSEGM